MPTSNENFESFSRVAKDDNVDGSNSSRKLTKFLHPFAHVVGGWFRGSLFRH